MIQTIPVDDLALSTLAARAAVLLDSAFSTSLKNTFLVKKVKYFLHLSGATAGQAANILACLNKGDATATEVAQAITELNNVGPEDTTQSLDQDRPWTIWQNTLKGFTPRGTASEAVLIEEISLGKGMPAISGQGISISAFNNDGTALDTGIVVNGMVQLWGVWLRD